MDESRGEFFGDRDRCFRELVGCLLMLLDGGDDDNSPERRCLVGCWFELLKHM